MTYLRVTSPSEERWAHERHAPPPIRRRGPPVLSLSLALLLGVVGVRLILSDRQDAAAGAAETAFAPPGPPPETAPATPPRLRIVLTPPDPAVATHPETWAVFSTALAAPIAAAPLSDPGVIVRQAAVCREAPGMATQMVCVDPVLAAADQQASDAYEAVLAAGASPAAVGRSQARWMLAREEAARSSPEDLLAAYQERTRRLRAAAMALERERVGA